MINLISLFLQKHHYFEETSDAGQVNYDEVFGLDMLVLHT